MGKAWGKTNNYRGYAYNIYSSGDLPIYPLMGYELELDIDREYGTRYGKIYRSRERILNRKKLPIPPGFHVGYETLGTYYGWEVKSPVARMRKHKQIFNRFKDKIEWNNGTDVHENNGGIHVNVSKTGSISEDQHRLLCCKIISKFNRDKLITLGEREGLFYCDSTADRGEYYHMFSNRKPMAYELRLFKSKPHLLEPALEMADSLVMFTKSYSTSNDFNKDKYCEYVESKSRRYPTLLSRLQMTGGL